MIKYNFRKPQERQQQFCQCGQISMYILSIAHQLMVTRLINNYSESFRMIDDRRVKNALFLFLIQSLPGNQTWEILEPSLHWHRRLFLDAMPMIFFNLFLSDTDGVLRRLEAKVGRFLWLMPRWKKRILWRLLDPLQDCGGLDFSGGFCIKKLRFNPGGKLRLIGSN